ncbi:hypothetical protein GBAR_LOCUS525 [Geodia barretti]|uniref:Uncharacterized protein n=1 Tax=Geodia barretti TaxID=519541 RepID=A0AA35VSR8_GEOBA|nr:hypothetical protein GBAR_LOCUS525 [Geodia barretti]
MLYYETTVCCITRPLYVVLRDHCMLYYETTVCCITRPPYMLPQVWYQYHDRGNHDLHSLHSAGRDPQCPFLHEDFGTVPQNWTNVTVRFTDNSATLGSAIYVSRLNTCSWFSRKPPFFNNTFLVDWPIWIIEPTNVDTGYTEEEQRNTTVSVQTQVNTLIISNHTVSHTHTPTYTSLPPFSS